MVVGCWNTFPGGGGWGSWAGSAWSRDGFRGPDSSLAGAVGRGLRKQPGSSGWCMVRGKNGSGHRWKLEGFRLDMRQSFFIQDSQVVGQVPHGGRAVSVLGGFQNLTG